jgi:hypothetical protein
LSGDGNLGAGNSLVIGDILSLSLAFLLYNSNIYIGASDIESRESALRQNSVSARGSNGDVSNVDGIGGVDCLEVNVGFSTYSGSLSLGADFVESVELRLNCVRASISLVKELS